MREWFRSLVGYQLNSRWITDPIGHRASRPKILGPESERERRTNDAWCAKFAAKASGKK